MREGALREDLYFRLNVVPVRVPALRERREDIELLAAHFLQRFCERYRRRLTLDRSAADALRVYAWPGNVRELQNVVERMVSLASDDGVLGVDALPAEIRDGGDDDRDAGAMRRREPLGRYHDAKEATVERFERGYLRRLLADHRGNVTAAARAAGLSRRTVHRLLTKHRIDVAVDG